MDLIQTLPNGTIRVDYGPMRLTIQVSEDGRYLTRLAEEGARLAIRLLQDLAEHLFLIKQRSLSLKTREDLPEVVRRMIEATKEMLEPDLTPLAAVAGTISEIVADHIFTQGGTKVIVENGGDIAIRLKEGEVARVGIRTGIEEKKPSYLVTIEPEIGVEGVATSGLGGRSFTKGIASAATVFARKASLADAAATVIGNLTDVDAPGVIRTLAEQIYPETDIAGQWVTTRVGHLSTPQIEQALKSGLSKAFELQQRGLVYGAFIAVQGKTAWTESLTARLVPV